MSREIDKVAVVQLLEATKSVLDHVGRWRIELGQNAQRPPEGLGTLYGEVRRLRDYLQRCMAAYPNPPRLNLDEDAQNLLAACAVHQLGDLDEQLETHRDVKPRDRAWIEARQRTLAEWAVHLATRRLQRIPTPETRPITGGVREVLSQINRRLDAEGPAAGAVPRGILATGVRGHTGPLSAASVVAAIEAVPLRGDGEPEAGAARRGAGARPRPLAEAAESGLLDPVHVHDPRLRSMISMDLRAFERARAADDNRLAMVHLGSILEAAVVDFVLPQVRQLGISGTPESWHLRDLVVAVLGGDLSSADRACLLQLIAGRNLIRPAVQLTSPQAVTPRSLQQTVVFVRRVLGELGFAPPRQPDR